MQDVESAFIGGKPSALDLHPAERPHVDVAVSLAAPGTAPVLELDHFFGAVRDEIIDNVLVAQPVAARDGVVEMILEGVVRPHHAGGATLGGDGMAAHRVDFRDQRDLESGVDFGCGDRGPQARAAGADDGDIDLNHVHRCALSVRDPWGLLKPRIVRVLWPVHVTPQFAL